jgi:hypothetical protein
MRKERRGEGCEETEDRMLERQITKVSGDPFGTTKLPLAYKRIPDTQKSRAKKWLSNLKEENRRALKSASSRGARLASPGMDLHSISIVPAEAVSSSP